MPFRPALLSLLVALAPGAALAFDLEAKMQECNDCHGDNGVSQWSDVPTIAGIDAFVHSDALLIYRDRARPCADSEYRQGDTSRPATNMCDISADLSDDQIDALAEAYAALPFVKASQPFDPALAKAGKLVHEDLCEKCHTEAGTNPEDEAGLLGGQWMQYLETTFAQYTSGEREQPQKMKEKMDQLSAEDVTALLHYYAAQQ